MASENRRVPLKISLWGRRDTKRLNDRVNACQRTFDRVLIKRITFQFLKPGIVQTY